MRRDGVQHRTDRPAQLFGQVRRVALQPDDVDADANIGEGGGGSIVGSLGLSARRGTTWLSRSSMSVANSPSVAAFLFAAMLAMSIRLRRSSRHAVHSALTERKMRMTMAVAPRPTMEDAALLA